MCVYISHVETVEYYISLRVSWPELSAYFHPILTHPISSLSSLTISSDLSTKMGLRAAAHSSSSSIDSSNHPDLDGLLIPKPSGSSSSSSLSHKIKIFNGGTNSRNSRRSSHTRTDLSTDLRLGLSISPYHHSDLSSTTSSPRYVFLGL